MPKSVNKLSHKNNLNLVLEHKSLFVTFIALIIFSASFYAWWKNIYNSPENVFQGMINNNLRVSSVTRESQTITSGTPQNKLEQISFVPNNSSRSIITLKQDQDGQENKVVSETIGTLKEDFSRYVSIKTSQKNSDGKPLDYSSVENIWSKSDPKTEQPQFYNQSVLNLFMFGNVDSKTRAEFIKTINEKKAYEVLYNDFKPKKLNGKSAIVLPVKVNLEGYVQAVKIVTKQLGLGDVPGLDPESYKGQPPIELKITIDKLSRQIMQIDFGEGQIETYKSYGLNTPIKTPDNTISTADLQQKVQEIK